MKKNCLFLIMMLCFCYLVKAQPGSLDPAFGNGGKKLIKFGDANNSSENVQKVLVLADGKILVAFWSNPGNISLVCRLNSNGSIDQSYGENGFSDPLPFTVNDAALQADGKALLAGKKQQGNDIEFTVVRLNVNGIMDNSFDGDGIRTVPINPIPANYYYREESANAILVQPDGKIVVPGGSFGHSAVVRLNANGGLDNSFDGDGIATLDFGQSYDNIAAISLQSDGKIVIAGVTDFCNYCGTNNIAVARYNTNGSLDNSFDSDGKVITDISNNSSDLTRSMEIQPDGKIVIGAIALINYNRNISLIRYNTDGSLDNSFDADGKVINNTFPFYDGWPNPLKILQNGKILFGMLYSVNDFPNNNYTDFAILRFNADGSIDNTLNGNGMVSTHYGSSDIGTSLALLNDGKIIFAGLSQIYGTPSDYFVAIKYNSDLSLDNGFGQNGIASGYFPTDATSINDIAIQQDGRIIGVGNHGLPNYSYEGLLLRLNPDGSYDNSLNGTGRLFITEGIPFAVRIQSDGKYLVAGTGYDINTGSYIYIRRFNTNGSADNSFDGDGLQKVNIQLYDYENKHLAIAPDGKIFLGAVESYYSYPAGFTNRFLIWKFNTDGTADNGFDGDGNMIFNLGTDPYGNSIIGRLSGIGFQAGNKIIVGGSYNAGIYPNLEARFWTARINQNGTLDNSFDGDGIAMISHGIISSGEVSAHSLAVQSDGKIVVAGFKSDYSVYPVTSFFLLTRFTMDGPADNGFDGDGIVITNGPPLSCGATSLAIQDDGKIIAGGYHYSGGPYTMEFMIARYNADGSLDNSFDGDGIAVHETGLLNPPVPKKLAIFNNRLYAGGTIQHLTNYNGIIVSYILSEVLSCPSNKSVPTTAGLCSAIVNAIDPIGVPAAQVNHTLSGATTGSGTGSASGKTFNKGITTVTYTATTNPIQTCSFTVTVNDNENPVLTCPAGITQNTLPLLCNALVNTPAPVKTDNCGVTKLTWAMSGATSGSSPSTGINNVGIRLFNKGVTTVTYTASDAAGNSSSCSFTVTVLDNQSPIMICPLNIIKSAQGNCSVNVNVPNPLLLFDNCAVTALTWVMTGATTGNSPATGMNYVGTRTFNVGITTISYAAKDAANNASSCSFTVRVNGPQNCNNSLIEPDITSVKEINNTRGITDTGVPLKGMNGELSIRVYPNPSNDQFAVELLSGSNEKMEISILDAAGRMIKRLELAPQRLIRFGQDLKPGIYMVEVKQGPDRKLVKVVKQ